MRQIELHAKDGLTQKSEPMLLFSIILCDLELQPFYLLSMKGKLPIVV
jgi:hypothetical protein